MALITNFLLGNIFYSYQRAAMNLAWYSQLKGKKFSLENKANFQDLFFDNIITG